MAGLNVIFDEDEYIDHGSINESWFGPLDKNHSGWVCNIRLIEVPLEGEEDSLFVVLREEDFTQMRGIFIGDDPRDNSFDVTEANTLGGGYLGGHVREDGSLSLGTPYKAFSKELAYLGSYQFMLRNCSLRFDEVSEEHMENFSRAERQELGRVQHRVCNLHGREVRKEDI